MTDKKKPVPQKGPTPLTEKKLPPITDTAPMLPVKPPKKK